MKRWLDRPLEERHLLNPAFCSSILWYAAKGASDRSTLPRKSLSFAEAFLVIPLVLHKKSRESLPSRINTSLPVWIEAEPLLIANFPARASALLHYTKQAIIFGGSLELFSLDGDEIKANISFDRKLNNTYRDSSDEVRECLKKASFLGKWFAHTGAPETIYTLFGVRP